jgi:hypothetical protein
MTTYPDPGLKPLTLAEELQQYADTTTNTDKRARLTLAARRLKEGDGLLRQAFAEQRTGGRIDERTMNLIAAFVQNGKP